MRDKVNLAETLATFDEPFSPRIVGHYNGNKLQVAKTRGEFVWHSHPDTDDLFLVVAGQLTIRLRDREVELGPGDLYVVPGGRRALPRLGGGCRDPADRVRRHPEHRRLGRRGGARDRALNPALCFRNTKSLGGGKSPRVQGDLPLAPARMSLCF